DVGESSATFEGLDIFGPASAFLANGRNLTDLGPPVRDVLAYPAFRAPAAETIDGLVLSVDRFGNLITDILAMDLPARPLFHVAGRTIRGVSRTYGLHAGLAEITGTAPLAIVGSSGRVEIALPGASAAEVLGL